MKNETIDTSISDALAERAAQVQRGGARAAVLGVNDGLVSTLCLVVAVAAAGADATAVLMAGFAGLLAGAISMAAGEWISVRTQVELFEGVLSDIKRALKQDKNLLMQNLAHTLISYGIKHKEAHGAVKDVAENDEDLMALYSSQVVGMNKDELGSPWRVAMASFALFSGGSLVPLIAWLIGLRDGAAIITAIVLTAIAGLFVGAFTAHSSGRNIFYGAMRQLLIIVFSAAVTYGIGSLFGVALG